MTIKLTRLLSKILLNCLKFFTLSALLLSPLVNAAAVASHGTSLQTAVLLSVNDKQLTYKFNYLGDESWFIFYAYKNLLYDIEISDNSVSKAINPEIELYNAKGVALRSHNIGFSGEGELLSWSNVPEDGYYYIRITNQAKTFSSDARFALKVYLPYLPNNLLAKGIVTDQCTNRGINEAVVETSSDATLSYKTGEFALTFPPGTYTLTARISEYDEQSQTISLKKGDLEDYVIQTVNFALLPKAGCPAKNPVIDTNQLKQQATAIYDDQSGELQVKDVRFGDQSPFSANLQGQANFIFKLIEVGQVNVNNSTNSPAFYDFDTSLVDIPSVFAFGKNFHIQLRMIDPSSYLFELTGTPTELP